TADLDFLIARRHRLKAGRSLAAAYPNLDLQDLELGSRLFGSETGSVLNLLKQRGVYREAFKHTRELVEEKETFRIPSLEMALAMTFAGMYGRNQDLENRYQSAHDFLVMVNENPAINERSLQKLGSLVDTEEKKD